MPTIERSRARAARLLLLVATLWLLAGCGGAPAPTPTPPAATPTTANPLAGLEGGVLAEFLVVDETFTLWTTNPQTIEALISLGNGDTSRYIPSGPVLPGAGVAGHNEPYSWHLDPTATVLLAQADNSCNWVPSIVEADVSAYIATYGRFCPSVAVLTRLLDLR